MPTPAVVYVGRRGIPGPQGAAGTGLDSLTPVLVGLEWGTPTAEASNAIEVTGTVKDFQNVALNSSIVDVEILVTDGANDHEPSATATLSAGTVPVGTVLSGSGTARLVMRTSSGSLKVKVTETAAGNRYLWIKQNGHARLWVRAVAGVLELTFA